MFSSSKVFNNGALKWFKSNQINIFKNESSTHLINQSFIASSQPVFNHQNRTLKRKVKIIVLKDFGEKLFKGDVLMVAPGYMRNFLYPNRIATYATTENFKKIENEFTPELFETLKEKKKGSVLRNELIKKKPIVWSRGLVDTNFLTEDNDSFCVHMDELSGKLITEYKNRIKKIEAANQNKFTKDSVEFKIFKNMDKAKYIPLKKYIKSESRFVDEDLKLMIKDSLDVDRMSWVLEKPITPKELLDKINKTYQLTLTQDDLIRSNSILRPGNYEIKVSISKFDTIPIKVNIVPSEASKTDRLISERTEDLVKQQQEEWREKALALQPEIKKEDETPKEGDENQKEGDGNQKEGDESADELISNVADKAQKELDNYFDKAGERSKKRKSGGAVFKMN